VPDEEQQEPFTERFLILCEGVSDNKFFTRLLEVKGINGFQVTNPAKGRAGMGTRLRAIRLNEGFDKVSAILVVSDNNGNAGSSFAEVRSQILQAKHYRAPSAPLKPAKIASEPAIVVVMLPWQDELGCLETMIVQAASDKWADIRTCLGEYLKCTPANAWGISKQSKMLVQCMVAAICKDDPNCSLTYLWSKPDFIELLGHASFNQLAGFLASFPEWLEANQ
jgi:hypothetical protein